MKRCLLLFCALLASCASLVGEPEVAVQKVNLVKLDSRGADLEFFLQITNPNMFGLTLLGYSYDLQALTLPLAKGGARERVEFPGGASTALRLPVRMEYGELWEVLKRRPDPERVPYRLRAGFEVDTPLGMKLIPVDQEGTFAVPREYRPTFYLQKLKELFDTSK